MKKYFSIVLIFILLLVVGCSNYDKNGYQKINNPEYISNQNEDAIVKNIILLIGDGMGVNHIEATKRMNEGIILDIDSYEYKSSTTTYCLDSAVTDSAAAGTALATGFKTNLKRIGMDEKGEDLKNILEYAIDNGFSAGMVTDVLLYDATPAAFTSHVRHRSTYKKDIMAQQIASEVNVLMGLGDQEYCVFQENIENNGFLYVNNKKALEKASGDKVFGIFPDGKDTNPTLYEMTDKAIELLSKNEKGFVLVVECGIIDKLCHKGMMKEMTDSVLMLDKTLRVILNYMRSNDNTLVITTADHETGGIVIGEGVPTESWFTSFDPTNENKYSHTDKNVDLYAFGTRSNVFDNKQLDNTDVFKYMKNLLKLN